MQEAVQVAPLQVAASLYSTVFQKSMGSWADRYMECEASASPSAPRVAASELDSWQREQDEKWTNPPCFAHSAHLDDLRYSWS